MPPLHALRNDSSQAAVQRLASHIGGGVRQPFHVTTRRRGASSHGQTIYEFDPKSRGAADYRALVKRIVETDGNDHLLRPINVGSLALGGPVMRPVGLSKKPAHVEASPVLH